MPTVNERCKILRSLNRVYVFEIVLLLVPRLKILRRRGLSYFGIFEKQEAQSSSQETNHNTQTFKQAKKKKSACSMGPCSLLPFVASQHFQHMIEETIPWTLWHSLKYNGRPCTNAEGLAGRTLWAQETLFASMLVNDRMQNVSIQSGRTRIFRRRE